MCSYAITVSERPIRADLSEFGHGFMFFCEASQFVEGYCLPRTAAPMNMKLRASGEPANPVNVVGYCSGIECRMKGRPADNSEHTFWR